MAKRDNGDSTSSSGTNVGFQVVGPLTRSTFPLEAPTDAREERLQDARFWSFSTRLQSSRLAHSLKTEFQNHGAYWRARDRYGTTSYDEHCLFVAAGNLCRAIQRLAPTDLPVAPLPARTVQQLKLLRNIYEHWDELRPSYRRGPLRRSAKILRTEFPEAEPWNLQIMPDGEVLVAKVVSLRELVRELRTLEAAVSWRLRAIKRASSA